jgi:acyl carrier protein
MPPLRGIIHAAGVLDDGSLLQQSWSRFEKVMAPKIEGAWHLHALTQHMPLQFFVLFSAGAALLGSPGQSNYAAANAFLDGLAHYRHQQGLSALSINWGPWTEVGMAAALDAQNWKRWAAHGINFITPKEGVQILGQLLSQNKTNVAVLPIDWTIFKQQAGEAQNQSLFQELTRTVGLTHASVEASSAEPKLLQQLLNLPPVEQHQKLLEHVQEQVGKVLGLDPTQLTDLHQGFTDLGMDSLMAVEISKRLQSSVGKILPPTLAFEYATIEALTGYLAAEVLALEAPQRVSKEQEKSREMDDLMAELSELSEDELEDAIFKELKDAGY